MTTPPFQPPFTGTPVWQAPAVPPPYAPVPAGPAPVAVMPLRGPLWGPQDGEGPAEHRAFTAWLMGGYERAHAQGGAGQIANRAPDAVPEITTRGDWGAALGCLGCDRGTLESISRKWSWHLRGREYWRTVVEVGDASARGVQQTILEFAVLARELDRKWLELELLELDKAIVLARRISPAPGQENAPQHLPAFFTPRELIALRRADGALEIARFRAGLSDKAADAVGAHERTEWAKLAPNELEAYRQLRDKARQA